MRNTLYRAKRIDNGEWITGALFPTKDGDPLICNSVLASTPVDESAVCVACHVDPGTIGAYTGLDDANNRYIFEGDILQFGDFKIVVFWNDEQFQWQAKKGTECWCEFPKKDWNYIDLGWIAAEIVCFGKMYTKIIGNIYDNPELVNKADDKNMDDDFSWDF